jgi:hypothetical protein
MAFWDIVGEEEEVVEMVVVEERKRSKGAQGIYTLSASGVEF